MAEELNELRAAIQHELELARSGDGYEEGPVADEIVERLVAPLLEKSVMEEALRWRKIVEQWEQGHQNEVLPYTAKLEAEVEHRKDTHDRTRAALLALLPEPARAAVQGMQIGIVVSAIEYQLNDWTLRSAKHATERDRAEVSRQAWAEEAMRLDTIIETQIGRFEAQALKADAKIGEIPDALTAEACWRNAAKWLRKAYTVEAAESVPVCAVHPDGDTA